MTEAMTGALAEALAGEPTRPLRRREYDQLIEAGAFADERIELLEGRLVVMSPQGSLHASVVQLLTDLLVRAVGERGYVRVQLPLAASDLSEPEPDFAVVPRQVYVADHPTTAALVVEVAESSLRKDRDVKVPLYAHAGVDECWLVDVGAGVVTVLRDPRGGRYADVATYRRGDVLTVAAFPDVTVPVAGFLLEG